MRPVMGINLITKQSTVADNAFVHHRKEVVGQVRVMDGAMITDADKEDKQFYCGPRNV